MRPRRPARTFHGLASCASHREHFASILTATWRPLLGSRPSRPLGLKDRLGLGALDQADHTAAGSPKWGILGLGTWPSAPGSYCRSGSSCPGASLRPAVARSARPTWA